jgi:hypothetical protein
MDDSTPAGRFTADQLATLTLPPTSAPRERESLIELDDVLKSDEISAARLAETLERYSGASAGSLPTRGGSFSFDPVSWIAWPEWLYIPRDADSLRYWVAGAPPDHRYRLAWTAPAGNTANRASAGDGTMFTFAQLPAEAAASDPSSESGVGIFYSPSMSLGVVEFAADVDVRGTLKTALEFFPTLAAGSVEVRAEILLCAWHVIPAGFDLLAFTSHVVKSSGPRDQSHGPEYQPFSAAFSGDALSARFLVQRSHTYLFGVVCRVSITSSLTANDGRPLTGVANRELVVYGAVNTSVPQMSVRTSVVYIP